MCGIAGFVLSEGEARLDAARAMCDRIRHRGPDDEGFHISGPCALGMRRLSIIDLSTGHQPIFNEDGSLSIVFNGEIYDYRELRQELKAAGHRLRTASDTETILHLYEQHGEGALDRLRGMFAFAIWDSRTRSLFLARDRFGKKPLYYAELPGGFWFASELKCLRAAGLPLDPDSDALRLYFQFGYVPGPASAYRQVRKLQPGCWLRYEPGQPARLGRYWRPPVPSASGEPGLDHATACARIREKFDEAGRIRMIADVPLGAFLSGGIDSSSVVASMALQSAEPVKTFSIGFKERAYNELEYAAALAKKYRTEHHEIVVEPDSIALIEKLASFFDEPFADSSAIPTYIVSEFAVQHVKVALSGDGGDELFAGYQRYAAAAKLARAEQVPLAFRRAVGWLAGRLPYSAHGKNWLRMVSRESVMTRYVENNFTPYFLRQRLLAPEWMLPAEDAWFRRVFAEALIESDADPVSQAMNFESCVNLPDQMLVKTDRMSMANSLEVRCPLLDHELAGLAAAVPHAWRIRNGTGKAIFLEALSDRLPPSLLNRPKWGFAVPLAEWFRGELRDFLRDHLLGARFLGRNLVSKPFLEHLLEEHQVGRRDNSPALYALLMLELWYEADGC